MRIYVLVAFMSFFVLACSQEDATNQSVLTNEISFFVKDKQGNVVKGAFLVLSKLEDNRLVLTAEGNSNKEGKWNAFCNKKFKGYISIIASGYEPCKKKITYESGQTEPIVLTLEAASSLSVLSYNVLEGLKNSPERKKTFAEWVQKYEPDVLLFQELNHFTEKTLKEFARTYGHTNAYIVKENGYPTGITSKYPITNVQKITNGQTHGYVHAECKGIHFFIIHLSPRKLNTRIAEIEQIIRHIQALPENSKVLVAGDFNSYNAYDETSYGPTFIADRKKFAPTVEVDYTVTNKMLYHNFKDAFTLFSDGHFKKTIPVNKLESDPNKGCRYDYIFLSESLSGSCVYSDILREKMTHELSDHYPVYIRLKNFK